MTADGADETAAPDAGATARVVESPEARSVALVIIAVIVVFAALYAAKEFFIPLALAILLNLVLSPVVQWLEGLRIPPPVSAGLVLLVGVGAIGLGSYELAGPVRHWIATGPETLSKATHKLRGITAPIQQVSKVADQVQKATALGEAAAAGKPGAAPAAPAPGLPGRLLVTGEALFAGGAAMLLLLYFLLAVGDLFLEKLVNVLPRRGDREKALSIARTMESAISSYLFLTTVINVAEGLVVAGMTALFGLPNPFLWGALVTAAEFIPYVGMLAMVVVLAVASLTTFDSISHALAVPAAYAAIDFVQANLVTPLVMGKRLALNPVAVFVSLSLGWWMWGVSGVFLAVPMLASFKIYCDHVESLASIGAFLGDRDTTDGRSAVRARLVRIAMAGRAPVTK